MNRYIALLAVFALVPMGLLHAADPANKPKALDYLSRAGLAEPIR